MEGCCSCMPEPDYTLEQQVEVKQMLGLRYNHANKMIEVGIKCQDKSIEMALKLEEVRELQAGLAMVLEEAFLAANPEALTELPVEAETEAPSEATE